MTETFPCKGEHRRALTLRKIFMEPFQNIQKDFSLLFFPSMMDASLLHMWFQKVKRFFPWRETRNPYHVWVSEVMLQQTRASVVVPYFERWMQLFPNVQSLAKASHEEVIKAWEGLGYYNRARHLHEGAKMILEKHEEKIPDEFSLLKKIPGIGSYTVRAILSFAFHQRYAPVDGNVLRVLSRYFCIKESISKSSVKASIQARADLLLDPVEPHITGEALIELGAIVCLPKPLCEVCPIHKACKALEEGRVLDLPVKAKAPCITKLERRIVVIEVDGFFLVQKQREKKVMAGLYEFPSLEENETPQKKWGLVVTLESKLPRVKHSFTRFFVELFPVYMQAEHKQEVCDMQWLDRSSLAKLSFSAGHRKIFHSLG